MKKHILFFSSICCLLFFLVSATVTSFAADGYKEGKMLVEKKCSVCHPIERVYGVEKSHSEWEKTVEKMMRYSDQMNFLNQQEKEAVINFLADQKSSGADSER